VKLYDEARDKLIAGSAGLLDLLPKAEFQSALKKIQEKLKEKIGKIIDRYGDLKWKDFETRFRLRSAERMKKFCKRQFDAWNEIYSKSNNTDDKAQSNAIYYKKEYEKYEKEAEELNQSLGKIITETQETLSAFQKALAGFKMVQKAASTDLTNSVQESAKEAKKPPYWENGGNR
jgi:uncharacterized coiled-coil protein SlyX